MGRSPFAFLALPNALVAADVRRLHLSVSALGAAHFTPTQIEPRHLGFYIRRQPRTAGVLLFGRHLWRHCRAVKLPRAKVWLAVAGLLLVLLVLLGWSRRSGPLEQRIARYRAAGQPTTLAELDAWYVPVPDSENAATALLEAASDWRTTGNTNLPGTPEAQHYPKPGEAWSAVILAATQTELASNAAPLAQMHAALQRPRSRYPTSVKAGVGLSITHLATLKNVVGRKLALEAHYAAETGDPARATSALLAVLGSAHTLEQEPELISYLVRVSMIGTSLEATERVLSRTDLTEGQLRRLQAAFVEAEAPNHLTRVILGRRCLALDTLSWPAIKLVDLFSILPDRTPPMLANMLAQLYDGCGLKRRDIEFCLDGLDELAEVTTRSRSEMPGYQLAFQTHIQRLASWRGQLRPVSRKELPILTKALTIELRWVATLRCAQTAMAVERWRLAHAGALPASLGELVPQYLPAVPEDPLDGKALKYHTRKQGYVVYSLGEDGIDQGGTPYVSGTGKTNSNDYTFTVAR